jgi:hypothetical protein
LYQIEMINIIEVIKYFSIGSSLDENNSLILY